jgi:hypothetical protein
VSWWEQDYVYDVGVAQFVSFVRPLYPPDHPDGPVPDGPDVEAVKRAVSRLGRWPWPSDPGGAPFDQSYSNAFAHGRSGNVGESGLEGVQRQAKIAKAAGAMGERTYDVLLYARIPQGLPHAGEFAMDDRAIALLQQAVAMFPKDEPEDEQPSSPTAAREKAMEHQARRVGYTEQPAGSNCDTRSDGIRTAQDHTAGGGTWLRYQPWCGCWCYYALEAAGVRGIDSHLASVASIEDYARQGAKCYRGWTTDRSRIEPGDLVIVGGYGVHVEQVRGKAQADGGVPTYGGNTSADYSGSQSNGGGAFTRTRYPSEVRGFALVRFPGE